MRADIAIRNGRVIDTANGVDAVKDIFIHGGKIIEPGRNAPASANLEVDASGCVVTPGLIDLHVHMYNGGTGGGFSPEMLLPLGVTAAVDAGSTGVDTFAAFGRSVLASATPACFALVNVSPVGVVTEHWPECLDPQFFSVERTRELMEAFPGRIKGLKVRMSREYVRDLAFKPLEAAIAMGEELGLPVVVHTSDPPRSAEDLVSLLRPGDIYGHCFNPNGSTILDAGGRVKKAFFEARERGVIFDSSSARIHSSFPMVKAVLEQGFYPDVLSTDLINLSVYHPFLYGLPYVITYYMAMGMDLVTAVRCATQAPAKALGLEGLGALTTGSRADVSVFRQEPGPLRVKDYHGNTAMIEEWFVPQMTVVKGRVVYRQMRFRTE